MRRLLFAVVFALTIVEVQNLDARPVYNGDLSRTLNQLFSSTERAVRRIREICDRHCADLANDVGDAAEQVEEALGTLNGETMIIDNALVDAIKSDATRLQGLSGAAPPFAALTDERAATISGDDPEAAIRALDDFASERDAYIDKLERWEQKRADAIAIRDDAHTDYLRATEVNRRLGDAFGGAGAALLSGIWRFDMLHYDLMVPLNDALSSRHSAAIELVQSYDEAIAEMKWNIARTQDLAAWRLPLKIIHDTEASAASPDDQAGNSSHTDGNEFDPDGFLKRPVDTSGMDAAANIQKQLLDPGLTLDAGRAFFEQALAGMSEANNQVIDEAARLWRDAARKDREAERAKTIQSVANAALDIAAAAMTTKADGLQNGKMPSFWFQETWQWSTDSSGNQQIIRDRSGGVH